MATVYVSPTGSDAYTYEQAQVISTPWATIGKCNTSATNGDTIICADGTHTWASVAFAKGFTIRATTNNAVTFDAGGANISWSISGSNLTFSFVGINFTNNSNAATSTCFASNNIGITYNFTNCIFYNLYGVSNIDSGGYISCGASYLLTINITRCLFYNLYCVNNGAGGGNACMISGRVFATTITNSTFYFNQSGTAFWRWIQRSQAPLGTVNTFVSKNNIFLANSATMTALCDDASGRVTVTATYTCQAGNWTTVTSGTGNITSDPLFVDVTANNFNLRPTSPCIGTGTLV